MDTEENIQKMRRKIRNKMIEDGFSEYGSFGKVSSKASEIWETEFQNRVKASEK
jgi:hypothetical protein